MTPLELAEEIERMDEYGARAADRRLIAAAIRLAEAATPPDAPLDVQNRRFLVALAAYRAARDGRGKSG